MMLCFCLRNFKDTQGGSCQPQDGSQAEDGACCDGAGALLYVRSQHVGRGQGGSGIVSSSSSLLIFQDYVDTTGNIMVDIADGIGMVSKVTDY